MAKDVRFLIHASADNAVAEMKKMQANGEDVSKLIGYAFQRLGTTSDSVFQKQKDSARTAYELIKKSGVASADDIARAHAALETKLSAIDKNASLQGLGQTAKNAASDVQGLTSGIDNLFSSVTALAGPAALGMLISQTITAALATERYTAAMEASTGSSQAAAREIQFIREESNRLGLDFVATAGSFAKFTASTRGTVLEGEATRKIFVGVSEAVTAMKLSGDDANGIFLALSQMMSKGKISAEELSGQLGERLPGTLKLTADAMGMTTTELLKQMEQGKLMSSDVLPKLAEQLHKTYGEAAKKSAEGGQAGINRFNNEIKETASVIGANLMPALTAMGNKTASMLKTLRENPPKLLANWSYIFGLYDPQATKPGAEVSSQKPEHELEADKIISDQRRAKESADRAKTAAEAQKKEMDKQKQEALKAFQDKSKGIIDIEKDRVSRLLTLEKEYGTSLKEQYKERVAALDTFRNAMETISESKAARDKKRAEDQSAALRGDEDAYQKYYRTRAEIAQAEIDLDSDSSWSPESIAKKLKAYDALIIKSETQMEQARTNNIESISSEQTIYDARETRERLEAKIEEIGKRQIGVMEQSAIAAASESAAWQKRIDATQDRVRVLDQMLQNLPRVKDIDINLKINGLASLQQIPGVMQNTTSTAAAQHFGDYYTMGGSTYWNDGTLADSGTSFVGKSAAPVTSYSSEAAPVSKSTSKSTAKAADGYNTGVTITGNIILPNVTDQTTARELFAELQKIGRQAA